MPVEESNPTMIETPLSLLPDLSELGIVEVDRGICEDTYENRGILRTNKIRWISLYNSDGSPSKNIQAVSVEMQEARLVTKAALLDNSRNVNSDYITGYQLVLNDDAAGWAPAWVMAATRKWNQIEDEREATGEMKWPHLAGPPGRCTALRMDGHRCSNWHNGSVTDGGYCRVHLNRPESAQNVLAKARNRMHSAAVAAVDELESLMNTATSEPVRLKASTEILDRVGIRAGFEIEERVEVSVKPAASMVADRLKKLRAVAQNTTVAEEDIVEAEVIKEEEADNER